MGTYRVIHRKTPPTLGGAPNPFAVDIGGGFYHVEPRYEMERDDELVADAVNGREWDTFFAKAGAATAQAVLSARVRRSVGTRGETETVIVRKIDVRGEDTVEEDAIPPHNWSTTEMR